MQADDTDRRILRQLVAEPGLATADIAHRAGVTAATCWRRLEKLTEAGFFAKIPAGIVLTGGASQLPGMAELGRNLLKMPVRIGAPGSHLPITAMSRALQSPAYATSVGLLLWGMHEDARVLHRRFAADSGGSRLSPEASAWMGHTVQWLRNLLPG